MLVGILFGALAWFVLLELIWSFTSSGTAGERKIVFLFSGPRYKRWVFSALTMFLLIFSAILVKQLLKWLEIFLSLVINWLSIRRLERDSSDFFFMFIIPFMVCHTSFRFIIPFMVYHTSFSFLLLSQSIVCNKILLSP